jgi:peptidoglycan DL-endopeptidase LytE
MNSLTKKVASVALGTSILFSSVAGASAATYTVKSGDTLSKIASQYGISYLSIMNQNGLHSTNIMIGQKLQIGSGATTAAANTVSPNGSQVVSVAKNYLGTRYVFGGSTPYGFDCSGFVYYVLKKSGKSISRTTAASYYSMSKKVTTPKIGDLVFFSNTYKKGISHVGIYIGSGKMISASGSNVNIAPVNSGYWKNHFTGYGRI